jgi:ferric-dicitrate binding protein FerR (iron transport regulator)
MTDAYEKLLSEVREDLGKGAAGSVDWAAVDEKLFARIEQERRAERARFSPQRKRGVILASVGLAAAAAIFAMLAGKVHEPLDTELAVDVDNAGTLVAIDGAGPVLLDGRPVRTGAALALGDVLETRGAQATVERAGKVTLTLEPGSRAAVTHVRGALVLSLEQGAIEAQVVPVGAGEAFAVDVEGSRVAVHGTHLRVARTGDRVAVDLNEGVVSVGEAPRAGSLLGTLVNAPAHVEFAAADAAGTLVQTHDAAAVRPPQVLRPASTAAHPSGPPPASPHAESTATHSAVPAADARSEVRPPPGIKAKPAVSAQGPTPQVAIANAVRACMAERPRADNVTVVVSTALHLELTDDGTVRSARFDPPVAPDVNACAAPAIYRERFAHGGPLTVAIDFTN